MSLSSSPVGGAGPRSTTGETLFRFLRRRLPTVFLLVLLILVLGGSSGRATTVVKMTFSEVVDGAELIVIGTVSAIEETWDAAKGMPFTDVTFSDIEVLKGTARAGELTLRFLGGPAPNGLTLAVSGMPRFAMNEQTVIFSAGNGVYPCPLVGWWQGLYRVVLDDERNVPVVADHAGRSVVALDGVVGERDVSVSSSPAAVALTLDEFTGLVTEELQ